MTDVSRALEQIAAIHAQLAKGEVYRGWRPIPVVLSGLVGLGAAAVWQGAEPRTLDPTTYLIYWIGVAVAALLVGCSEIVWHYVRRATVTERRQSRQVLGHLLPALAAGALVAIAIVRRPSAPVALLPGIWALLFGVAIFAARPYLPRASVWVALYFCTAGSALLALAGPGGLPSPWEVGGTFGLGQFLAAAVIHWSPERRHEQESAP